MHSLYAYPVQAPGRSKAAALEADLLPGQVANGELRSAPEHPLNVSRLNMPPR
ncbi:MULTISPECIES: hypothetical protein [Pseudomonas]|jgi:hypothetical protein|uniref:MOSC domain-containing protein n=1 Tax=Pseudomonas carnis TaxID=2487355 RepID=A0ABT5RGV6_9PSED|nr:MULTISPECIES: hypothetical protein [Pseudomonas]MBA1255071.1 hypothetical protein [Pseudomonas carnis]MBA1269304.1 hypothetical protein [Pseudomonas carnis]MBA1300748.1 hypothetical protein [Pseudomonas carnis]MBJ2202043.1 hypothetical protein [Pseudomonas carnis]MBJ2208874.1 hypothetical protein [Pseudomonas carnis]